MSKSCTDWPADLSRLDRELREHRGACSSRQENYSRIQADAQRLAKLPLVHGCEHRSTLEHLVRERGDLCSRTVRGASPNDAEACLGIHDKVYASLGVLYPDKAIALLFSEYAETTGTMASPWDSGASNRELETSGFSADERRRLFNDYSLKEPWHRHYLVEFVASCFWNAADYLDVSCRHAFPDPLGLLETMKPRLRSFEVRVPTRIPLDQDHLVAVFLRQGKTPLPDALSIWLDKLEQCGVVIEVDRKSRTCGYLQANVEQWVRQAYMGLV